MSRHDETDEDLPDEPDESLRCPKCMRETDSLKQYRYMDYFVFLGSFVFYRHAVLAGCPSCVRPMILRRLFYNIIPANITWPFLFLPWGIGLLIASTTRGHSKEVRKRLKALRYLQENPSPEEPRVHPTLPVRINRETITASDQSSTDGESWGRILAVLSVLTFWLPCFGLVITGVAYFVNRKADSWVRPTSLVGLVLSAALHVLGTAAFVASEAGLFR